MECEKAWYGLPASPSLWNKEIHKTLTTKCGYICHTMVSCLYYKYVDNVLCMMLLHVDDIGVLMPQDDIEYNRVKRIL